MTPEEVQENTIFKKNCILNFNEYVDFETPVYRVYPIERLLELFNQQKNTLVKPKMWDDPFENLVFQQTANNQADQEIHFDGIRECLYGQCWTLNIEETDALWRIYSPSKNGVRVKTTLKKLWDGFYNERHPSAMISFFIGKIIYESATEIQKYFEEPGNLQEIFSSDATGIVNTILIKRKEFEHENEVRLVFRADDKKYDITKRIYQYDFNPINMFDEILFDPRFDDGIYEIMKSEFNRRGFTNPIEKSTLYQAPKFQMKFQF
jgi:hypothetical protein